MEQNKPNLKVIIVGGSIAGLTLAHCLSRLKIDYVVLERHNEIAPQIGASVSLMPNGARIIDQLGMFDTLFEGVEPCIFMRTWTGDGKLLSETDSPILTGKRLGYTITFVERERLLQVLYDHLPDKSKVLTGKQVDSVKQNEKEAVVYCTDGSNFSGDIIAGADGVRSFIRAEMRRQIAAEGTPSDLEALEKDKKSLSAEYNCLFGISKPIKGLDIGKTHRSLSQGASTLLFTGAEGRVYWFLFAQNPERLFDSDIPRYSKSDEAKHAAKFARHHVTGDILFSTLWEHRIVTNFVAIEEMENEHWVWNRVACLGDSVHKMTPNLGQGANCAIESAAELANQIAKCEASRKGKPSHGEVTKALHSYHQERRTRANLIVKIANKFTRVEALATTGDWVASMFILPRLGDILADRGCKVQVGATKLEFLKMPERAIQGTMPWSRQSGVGKEENRKRRAQFALPLLLASIAFYWISRTARAQGLLQINNAISSGAIQLSNGKEVSLFRDYFGFAAIDDRIATYVARLMFGFGSDSDWKIQTLSAMSTNLSMVVIWTIESFRRGNVLTIANIFPTLLLLLAQNKGSAIIAPVYYFFHYLQSPQENYAALDNRLTNMAFVKTFIPVLALIYVLPSLYVYTTADLQTLQWLYGYLWCLFPVYLAVALRILSLVVKDTTRFDRLYKPTADLPYLHFIYSICIIFCGSAHLYVQYFTEDLSFPGFFASFASKSVSLITSGPTNLVELWEANRLVTFGATLFWILLSFGDLKRARRLQAGWFRILGILILSTIVGGPDAAVLIMWAWREQAMAKKAAMETVET